MSHPPLDSSLLSNPVALKGNLLRESARRMSPDFSHVISGESHWRDTSVMVVFRAPHEYRTGR